MWDKYRHENKQTICIIGVLILAAKLAKIDGEYSLLEEEEILKIIPHEPEQAIILRKILNEAAEDDKSFEYDADRIKKLLDGDHPDFLEFIIAVLYKIAHSDHIYHEEEEKMIIKISDIFEIKEPFIDRLLASAKNITTYKLNFWSKQNA
ncbi:TerB family tellurite resistance protein [Pelagibacteraceae bacterium]|nr:TerB family tellurite resistance protein [Pelagibacteraceae bacterium]|tara:strand:- start:59 stop:508 length:450 start_codon:yes stop_codon:yes gene_type:complete